MFNLEQKASEFLKINIPLQITPQKEVQFQQSNVCWLCEELFPQNIDKVRDQNHFTGHYRGAAHNSSNLNRKQKSSNFDLSFFQNFSGYACHLLFKQL